MQATLRDLFKVETDMQSVQQEHEHVTAVDQQIETFPSKNIEDVSVTSYLLTC